jgi:hypothetical protein
MQTGRLAVPTGKAQSPSWRDEHMAGTTQRQTDLKAVKEYFNTPERPMTLTDMKAEWVKGGLTDADREEIAGGIRDGSLTYLDRQAPDLEPAA